VLPRQQPATGAEITPCPDGDAATDLVGGSAGWASGDQFGEVDEGIAQMLRREWWESDALSDGVRDG
jgi:hypothetical protein